MKKLLVLVGPTGVGKTELSLNLAEHYACPILSADSRQLYRGIKIGTAAPTTKQKARIEHHFVGQLEIDQYYSASDFEKQAISKLSELHRDHDVVVATGGSMMYIDALCYGVDEMPTIDPELRERLYSQYKQEGLAPILAQLKLLDPTHYEEVDPQNYKRVIHALEVCKMTGKSYSSFRTRKRKERPFKIVKVGIERNRDELYERINKRVDMMIEKGLIKEAEQFYTLRHLNALNTVGYKELFKYMDGDWELNFAIEKIKQSTRIYSRQQMRWFKKDNNTTWFNLSDLSEESVISKTVSLLNK